MSVAAGEAINKVQAGGVLSRGESAAAFRDVLKAGFDGADVAWGALFAALHTRGPTVDEVLGLVDGLLGFDPELARQLSEPVDLGVDMSVVAITGSGKETFKTFNVSTAAAFIAASHPDVCVVKPAGRATSAVTGANDLLQAVGVGMPRSLDEAVAVAQRCGLCVFDYHLVAPRYGPRYKGLFHHLHPLSHVTPWLFVPVKLDGLVFGVADERVGLAAGVMQRAGPPTAVVASTALPPFGRIDEIAPFGLTSVARVHEGALDEGVLDRAVPSDLSAIRQRSTTQANVQMFLDVLRGTAPVLAMDLVLANAAAILHVAAVADDVEKARTVAAELVVDGAAIRCLHACQQATEDRR